MIESLNAVLPVFIYALLIVLLVIGIILGIKLIITIDKVNNLVDDVAKKVSTLDAFFNIVSGITNKFGAISSKLTETVLSLFNKIGIKRKEDKEYE